MKTVSSRFNILNNISKLEIYPSFSKRCSPKSDVLNWKHKAAVLKMALEQASRFQNCYEVVVMKKITTIQLYVLQLWNVHLA